MTYFMYNGKEYTHVEMMPPDVRDAYTQWRQEQQLPDDLLDFYETEVRNTERENRGEKPLPSVRTTSTGHRLELLPATCPSCGGLIHGDHVQWTGTQSAECPYCGINLPMRTETGTASPQ